MLSTFTCPGCILFLPEDATCRIACYQHSRIRVAFCFYLETLLAVLHAINIHVSGLHSVSTWRRYLSYCMLHVSTFMLHVSTFTCPGCTLFLPGDATCRIACYQHSRLRLYAARRISCYQQSRVRFAFSQKELTRQTDLYLVILPSKTFEDKMTK